jgi:hypothetical protein
MICPPIRQLLGQPNCCIACRLPEAAIPYVTRFEKDGVTLLVCENMWDRLSRMVR